MTLAHSTQDHYPAMAARDILCQGLARSAGALFSPSGVRARLTILLYHRVSAGVDSLGFRGTSAQTFDWQMRLLKRCFTVLNLNEAVARLENGSLPARAACVTFDDGYADNAEVALPILLRHGVPATFFVAAGFLNGGRMFNDTIIESVHYCQHSELDLSSIHLGVHSLATREDRRNAVAIILKNIKHLEPTLRDQQAAAVAELARVTPSDSLMMTDDQVRSLAEAGMEVGGHTVSHPVLTSIAEDRARDEIRDGRDRLEEIIERPVLLFAYPNGRPGRDYTQRHVCLVKELGFQAAVSTTWGSASAQSDPYQLPRFTPWDRSPERFLARLMINWRRDQAELCS